MAIRYLDDGNDDGTVIWQTGSKGGFYGLATAIVQPTMTEAAITALTTTTVVSAAFTGMWAWSVSTTMKAYITRTRQMQADLKTLIAKLEGLGLISVSGN